jgi:excisionase family DNA binding protein
MGKILHMVDGPAMSGRTSGGTSGTDRPSDRQEYYTVSEAAKVLDISERRVRQIAQDGKVEGVRSAEGWKLFRYSVHDFRDRKEAQNPVRAVRGGREPSSEAREWIERVTALERELGRLEGRLELTERAESSMREERERLLEDLARERERATQEQEKAEETQRDAEQFIREREEAQEEARRLQEERDRLLAEAAEEARVLREELEAERSKGFWRRLFGG